ncbi:MAG: hypothetical protein ABEJ48_06820 [Halobacteriales archaeon]
MIFEPRVQAAFHEAGVETATLEAVSAAVVERVQADAAQLEAFFERYDTVYSDMDLAHSDETFPAHTVEYFDSYTHGADLRGWLRFDSWGVPVEDGRLLEDNGDMIELTLGPTVHDRVRFAPTRDAL